MPLSFRHAIRVAILCALVSGCLPWRPGRPTTYPVHGMLFVNGKPAAGARVRLFAMNNPTLDGLCPHAEVERDGSFQLMTYQKGDGAPEGTYALTVTWPVPPKAGKELGKDRFNGRYADPRHPVRVINVIASEVVLEPLRLP
jgi:hypothetical protein